MAQRTLYDASYSGHAHRPRALLGLLGVEYDAVMIDFGRGDNKTPEFLKLNPLGQVPVFVDGDIVIRDSTGALVYLVKAYDNRQVQGAATNGWLPDDPVLAGEVQAWLAVSSKEVFDGPVVARLHKLFGADYDHAKALGNSQKLLGTLFEPHLAGQDWLVGGAPTIADVANYGYIATSPEGGVNLDDYPSIKAWIERLEGIEGFPRMPTADEASRGEVER